MPILFLAFICTGGVASNDGETFVTAGYTPNQINYTEVKQLTVVVRFIGLKCTHEQIGKNSSTFYLLTSIGKVVR